MGRLEQYRSRFFRLFEQFADQQPYDRRALQPWLHRINRTARIIELDNDVPIGRVEGMRMELLNMLLEQGSPCTVGGFTVVVLIGADITISDYDNASSFLGGDSRAGDLTQQILTRLGGLDFPNYRFTARPFPFVDLYPWKDTVTTRDDAIDQLQVYMTAVLPIVTVSFSSWVSSVGFADFLHHYGLSFQEGNRYLQYVGIPRLVAILDKEWVLNDGTYAARQRRMTILIPHIDPGFERYGERSEALLHLLDLQLAITTIVSELVITCIVNQPNFNRNQVVQHVWDIIQNNQCDRIVAALGELEELKATINERNRQVSAQQPRIISQVNAAVARQTALANVERHGRAAGLPNSQEREIQITRLWRENRPSLHIHIGRDAMAEWMNWARQLAQNQAYFPSAMRHVGMMQHHPLHNAFQQVAPPNADPNGEWLNDEDQLAAAALRWGELMRDRYLPADFYSTENQRRRAMIRWNMEATEMDYTERMEGRSIYIPRISPATLRWQDGDVQRKLLLPFPRNLIPEPDTHRDGMRVLRFLQHGIGLEDHTGAAVIHRDSNTIINLDRLRGLADRENLMRLWVQERLQLGDVHAADVPIQTFQHIPMHQQRRPLSVQSRANTIAQFQQGIFRGDALALLGDFLDQEFPNGGLVNLASAENQQYFEDTNSIAFIHRFNEFLEEHYNHPHHGTWLYKNANITHYAKDYWPNIRILRPDSVSLPSSTRRIPGLGVRQCKLINIGPIPHNPIPRIE